MITYKVILKPTGIIQEFPASDTLFGAICWGINHIYGKDFLEDLLKNFHSHEDKFILSSTFPAFYSVQGIIHFYPILVLPDPQVEEMERLAKKYEGAIVKQVEQRIANYTQYAQKAVVSEYKKFEKIKYVSETLFNRMINGSKISEIFNEYLERKRFLRFPRDLPIPEDFGGKIKILKNMCLTAKEYTQIFNRNVDLSFISKQGVTIRNKIDRLTFTTSGSGEIYYQNEIFLKPERCCLYFIIKTDKIDFFAPIFKWLSDTGIGGERTTGKGHYIFEISEKPFSTPDVQGAVSFVTLSRYIPDNTDIDFSSNKNFYELLSYHSKVESMFFKGIDVWKDRIIYFKEGSILKFADKKDYYGMLKKVKEIGDKKIYQNGLCFPVFARSVE